MTAPDCTHQIRLERSDEALYVNLRCGAVDRTVALSDSVNVDLDSEGEPLGVEVLL